MKEKIISIDQGTTSSRAVIFSDKGELIGFEQLEFKQFFPNDGWVEHDPEEIWLSVVEVLNLSIKRFNLSSSDIASIGITNQRETVVIWDKKSGKPIYNAIVWQDRRTSDFCDSLKDSQDLIQQKTGLTMDPYFSASKVNWILDQVNGARQRAENGELLFGTIDSFLIWKLTEGKSHFTDITNASRTMIYDSKKEEWSEELLKLFNINKILLPEVKENAFNFGSTKLFGGNITIGGMAGDQQAATIGQCCFSPGSVKSTYGTGAFVLMNTGSKKIFSKNKLLTTICYKINNKTTYALEGSIFTAGAGVQWIRDKLKLINNAYETEKIAKSKKNNNGVYLVPAFTGLGAPHWDSKARGLLSGLTRNTGYKEIIRATIESTAYQTHDLFIAMRKDGLKFKEIKIDGGMSMNDWFSQFLSDILNVRIKRPKIVESTALGAAFMAGLNIGTFKSLNDISKKNVITRKFNPKIDYRKRKILLNGWSNALKKAMIR